MKNEPVAWIDEINTFVLNKDYKQFSKNLQNGMIPLYTHPAKTLTDEEILNALQKAIECAESEINGGGINWYAYAEEWKTILRKAQEK